MVQGIKNKDIRDFEKTAKKLGDIIARIREYAPEAYVYATPCELSLLSGVADEQEEKALVVASVSFLGLESGDW